MHWVRDIGAELAKALMVLALVFLGFGHRPVEALPSLNEQISIGTTVLSYADYCGQSADGADHAPCHACRIGGGADLPPMPCVAEPAFVAMLDVAYVAPEIPMAALDVPRFAEARAPPAA